jgi:outer membrane protein TolC
MMRSLARLLCLTLLISSMAGCAKPLFVKQEDYYALAHSLPRNVETDPTIGTVKPVSGFVPAPPDVNFADRPPRHLALQEAIAIALENGTVSANSGQNGAGIVNDFMIGFTGGNLTSQSDRLRILALNPATASAAIEQSLARFDAQWVTSMTWNNTDELTQGLSSFTNGMTGVMQSSIVKAMSAGGVVNVTVETDYRNLNQPPATTPAIPNPLYTSRLFIGIEQPLLRDFGTEINQLLNRIAPIYGTAMPGTAATAFGNKLTPLNQSSSLAGGGNVFTEGIVIARMRFDIQRAEFERNVNNMVLNVEVAYWKLYQAYGQLYSYEELLRLAHRAYMIYHDKWKSGIQDAGMKTYAPIKAKYAELRGSRLTALGAVLEAERSLRGIIGLPSSDGTRIVPVTAPTQAPFQANWDAALKDALALRPELVMARENLRLAQINLINQRNFLRPDLRAIAQYQPVGFGTGLTPSNGGTMLNGTGQPVTNGSLQSLAGDHFNDWTVGLVFNVPLGYRLEHAAVRQARLGLAQSYELLKDQEERATRILVQQYQKIAEWYARIEASTAERRAYGESMQAYFDEIRVGRLVPSADLLVVSGQLAQAMLKQFEAIAEYNNTLARYEWAKGSLLQFNNVVIAEGALPDCVAVRAVEHLKERTKALLLKQHPAPLTTPGQFVNDLEGPPQSVEDAPAEAKKGTQPVDSPTSVENSKNSEGTIRLPVGSESAAPQPEAKAMFQELPLAMPGQGNSSTSMPRELPREVPRSASDLPVRPRPNPLSIPTAAPVSPVADFSTPPVGLPANLPPAGQGGTLPGQR